MNSFVSVLLWATYLISLYFAVFWFIVLMDGGTAPDRRKKKMGVWPKVSIVVPAWNEGYREETGETRGVIEETIENVLKLDYPEDKYELIIVNDGSSDNTKELILRTIAKHKGRNITFIDKKVNQGKYVAMNDALKIATGDYFIALDGDSTLEPHVLKSILPYFTSDDIACVLPNMKVMKPKRFIERIQWYEYIINMFYKKLMSNLDCVHVAPGPFSVFRTDVLRKVGGYRPGYLTEDLEITFRLQKHHYRVLQVLDVEVATKVPPSLKAWYRQRNRWFKGAALNAIDYRGMMFSKQYGDFGIIQLPTVILSGILGVILVTSAVYYGLKPYVSYLWNMSYVDFDFLTFIKDLTPNLHYLDLNYATLVTAFVMIMMASLIIYFAHRSSSERVRTQGVKALLFYFFFYYLFMGIAWIGIAIDLLRKKKPEW